jgi:hypothetical protein
MGKRVETALRRRAFDGEDEKGAALGLAFLDDLVRQ